MARILLVDDEANVRLMIRLALQHVGHTVETAADGPEGLAKFGDGTGWELTLLDQRMPGMEGLEVLREIRGRDLGAKVIMITAFGTIDLAAEAIRTGATDFLRKPFTADILRDAVQAALQGRPVLPPDRESSSTSVLYEGTTINGFRIEAQPGKETAFEGGIRHAFIVHSPHGESRVCAVLLPASIIERIKAHAHREQIPSADPLWQALCEEALANYVWQHAEFPPDQILRIEELTTGLRRRVDAALSPSSAAHIGEGRLP
jgi:CheY-like chemotaxis protein